MADPLPTQPTPVSSADVANAKLLNQTVSGIIDNLSGSSSDIVDVLNSIAAAIAADIIGGSTGATANTILVSKGTGSHTLEAASGWTIVGQQLLGQGTNAGLELGNPSSSNTPYVDLHSSGNVVDYDVRLIASGGTAVAGNGGLSIAAATIDWNGVSLATLHTNDWTQQQRFPQVTLTDAATITWNGQTQQTAKLTLTASGHTLGALSNLLAGSTYMLSINVGSGPFTMSFDTSYKFPGGTAPSVSTTANATDLLSCYYNGSILMCVYSKAFA